MPDQTNKAFETLENWYRNQINKRRAQGLAITGGLAACYAVSPQLFAAATISSCVIFGAKIISSKNK